MTRSTQPIQIALHKCIDAFFPDVFGCNPKRHILPINKHYSGPAAIVVAVAVVVAILTKVLGAVEA